MDPKKLDPQDAFNLVSRREGKAMPQPAGQKDVEAGFGDVKPDNKPWWQKVLVSLVLLVAAVAMVSGLVAFYWFITQDSEPAVVIKPPPEYEPEFIGEERAKKIIETNLRAFLAAEDNETREKYIYPDGEPDTRVEYYNGRRIRDMPLWKIEQMNKTITAQGEIWMIVYRDLQKNARAVSFQRYGNDYRLHWLAMKAYCEMPWEKFIVERPRGPLVMRGYLRKYQGAPPLGVSKESHHVFLIEDQAGLFSELAVMERDAKGSAALASLPNSGSHPVTLKLGYDSNNNSRIHIQIYSAKHLRWQRMSADTRFAE